MYSYNTKKIYTFKHVSIVYYNNNYNTKKSTINKYFYIANFLYISFMYIYRIDVAHSNFLHILYIHRCEGLLVNEQTAAANKVQIRWFHIL